MKFILKKNLKNYLQNGIKLFKSYCDPPKEFTTNGNESKHSSIEDCCDYKEHNIYSFVKKISEMVLAEQKEIILGRMSLGQFHLKSEFK